MIVHPKDIKNLIEVMRPGNTIAFTNGCFDVLHPGHFKLLKAASNEMNHFLVVAINSDQSVKRLKGNSRPIHTLDDRMEMVNSVKGVDWVTYFSEDTPLSLIQMLNPDVLVKGGDYKENEIIGAVYVKSYGGRVKIFPFQKGHSTTQILATLQGKEKTTCPSPKECTSS